MSQGLDDALPERLGPRTWGVIASVLLGVGFGLAGTGVGIAVTDVTSAVSYAQMVAAVALATLLGGVTAGIAATVSAWALGAFALSDPRWTLLLDDAHETMRWASSAAAAAVVVLVGAAMRRGHERAAAAAGEAERSLRRLEQVQALTAGLSAAVTPAEVAAVMAGGVADALGARGGALGLVDGGDLLIVDPGDAVPGSPIAPGTRLPLAMRATITTAAREGRTVWVQRRARFVGRFPDGAVLAPHASSALSVPIRRSGAVIGAMGFHFTDADAVTQERRTVAVLAAELGGQALERARLYELERLAGLRTARLQEVTAALSQAVTLSEVATTCLEQGAAAIGAGAGVVALLTDDGSELETVESLGYDDGSPSPHLARLAVGADAPLAVATRTGRPVWALDDDALARFPEAAAAARASGDRGWVALPLVGSTGPIGAVLYAFRTEHALGPQDRELILALASQCAQAVERSRLYERERVARDRGERLQALTAALAGALVPADVTEIVREQGVGAAGADVAATFRPDDAGDALLLDGVSGADVSALAGLERLPLAGRDAISGGFRRGRASFHPTLDGPSAADEAVAGALTGAELRSCAVLPLAAGRRVHGILLLGWREAQPFDPPERAFAGTFASQGGQALDRALRYENERSIAETLQQSVLPDALPTVDGAVFAARYLPGAPGTDVGGDWYDAFRVGAGKVGLVVGDVVGKGVGAAATMGQLRNALRAFASEHEDPADVVARLGRLVDSLPDAPFATLVYAVLDLETRRCRLVIAGHPPPLVVSAEGEGRFVDVGRALPLGVDAETPVIAAETVIPEGGTMLLYTDGLVERRGVPLDEGLETVRRAAESVDVSPDSLLDHVLREAFVDAERRDDVAVLAVRLEASAATGLRLALPADEEGLQRMRSALRRWLTDAGAGEEEAQDMLLAAWEACANAVEHPTAPAEDTIHFALERLDDGLVRVVVSDTGRWRPPGDPGDRGLGLALMRGLMHRVDVVPSESGTTVVLERRLDLPAVRRPSARV